MNKVNHESRERDPWIPQEVRKNLIAGQYQQIARG